LIKPTMALLSNNEPNGLWFMTKSSVFEILPSFHHRAKQKP
jgi:hypothetical protein